MVQRSAVLVEEVAPVVAVVHVQHHDRAGRCAGELLRQALIAAAAVIEQRGRSLGEAVPPALVQVNVQLREVRRLPEGRLAGGLLPAGEQEDM